MITEVFNTKEEVVQEAIDYYWNKPERRCLDENMHCVYYPSGQSDGCAIGRYIDTELAENLDESLTVCSPLVLAMLPKWLTEMDNDGTGFLLSLQKCHDLDYFRDSQLGNFKSRLEEHVNIESLKFPTS